MPNIAIATATATDVAVLARVRHRLRPGVAPCRHSPSGRAGMEVTQKSLLLGWRDLIDSMGSSALGSRISIGSSTQVIMTTGYCHNLAPCPSASLPVLGPSDQPHAVEIATAMRLEDRPLDVYLERGSCSLKRLLQRQFAQS